MRTIGAEPDGRGQEIARTIRPIALLRRRSDVIRWTVKRFAAFGREHRKRRRTFRPLNGSTQRQTSAPQYASAGVEHTTCFSVRK